jgi:aminoglycoside 3-N-acetyltransferase I
MDYTYKQLGVGDTGAYKEMLRVFADAFKEPDTYVSKMPGDDYITSMLSKEHFVALVARSGSEVVGALAAYELQKFEQDRREMYIYDLSVAEAHRRKGVATTLVQELRRIAKERGVHVIYVQADREDEAAVRLYDSLGKREDVYHFDIEV